MACIPENRLLNAIQKEGFAITSNFLITPNLPAVLSTASLDGIPSSRTLYIKQLINFELYFFTSDYSQKIQDIKQNPIASLCLFFEKSFSQILIQGKVEKASRSQSITYFNSRDKLSRAGAIASRQSRELENYENFVNTTKEIANQSNLECPQFWNCYKIIPNKIEFWNGNKNRLHLRELFIKTQSTWQKKLLYP